MKQTVTIFGIPISVNTTSTDPQYLEDVAKYVEEIAGKISSRSATNLPLAKLSAMTALTIADELFQNEASSLPAARRGPRRVDRSRRGLPADQARRAERPTVGDHTRQGREAGGAHRRSAALDLVAGRRLIRLKASCILL